jgi:hypothetical protein
MAESQRIPLLAEQFIHDRISRQLSSETLVLYRSRFKYFSDDCSYSQIEKVDAITQDVIRSLLLERERLNTPCGPTLSLGK